MLPGTDGIQLMQTVPELADLPVIFISGYGRDKTIARALEAGADDYIVKPFSPTELTARIRAAPVPFALGALAIDYDQRRVTVAGRRVELTATEYERLRDKLADEADRPGPDRQRARGGLPHAPGPASASQASATARWSVAAVCAASRCCAALAPSFFAGAVTRRAVAQRRSRASGLTRPLAEAIRGFDSGFWG